jgi:trans-aconitate 2-methyltransferase
VTSRFDPTQYERFGNEREQPFHDLVRLIAPRPDMRVVDLGSGTGELTARLAAELHAAHVGGVDVSPAMHARARARATPALEFVLGDIEHFAPVGPLDLVWSHAALHWVPDHVALFRRLAGFLAPDGQLAIQMPANEDHASHVVARAVGAEPPFAAALGQPPRVSPVLPVERYATLLEELGFSKQHVRLQVYVHRLPEARAVVQWVKGSLLTWYEQRLGDELFRRFLERYEVALLGALGSRPDAPFVYTYKRLLIWARC